MAQFETLNQQNSDELRRYLFQLKADIENTINLMEDDQARFRQEVKTNNDALKREMQDVINKINSSSAVGEVYHNDTELAQGDISDSDEMPIYDASASTYKKTLFGSLKAKFWGYVQSQLATVATSGSYNDLSNKPNLATVATSGSYNDLSNKPAIPSAQVQTDWNATSGMGSILHKPNLATVATSGSYNDLSNKPTADSLGALKVTDRGTWTRSGGGTYNYCKIATLTVTTSYINYPIAFEISGRGRKVSKVEVMFQSSDGADPALKHFITSDSDVYWIRKASTSVWELYGVHDGTWGEVQVHRVYGAKVNNGVTVTMNMENVSSIPSGATQVSSDKANYVKKTESRFQGDIVNGNSILNVIKSSDCPWGLSFWYTQNANDAPYKGTVSFTLINKPTNNGTYTDVYYFCGRHLWVAQSGGSLPSALSFTQIF